MSKLDELLKKMRGDIAAMSFEQFVLETNIEEVIRDKYAMFGSITPASMERLIHMNYEYIQTPDCDWKDLEGLQLTRYKRIWKDANANTQDIPPPKRASIDQIQLDQSSLVSNDTTMVPLEIPQMNKTTKDKQTSSEPNSTSQISLIATPADSAVELNDAPNSDTTPLTESITAPSIGKRGTTNMENTNPSNIENCANTPIQSVDDSESTVLKKVGDGGDYEQLTQKTAEGKELEQSAAKEADDVINCESDDESPNSRVVLISVSTSCLQPSIGSETAAKSETTAEEANDATTHTIDLTDPVEQTARSQNNDYGVGNVLQQVDNHIEFTSIVEIERTLTEFNCGEPAKICNEVANAMPTLGVKGNGSYAITLNGENPDIVMKCTFNKWSNVVTMLHALRAVACDDVIVKPSFCATNAYQALVDLFKAKSYLRDLYIEYHEMGNETIRRLDATYRLQTKRKMKANGEPFQLVQMNFNDKRVN